MNTVTRLVLVPEDEFFRLKNEKMNETDKIMNSNLPYEVKVALSNEIDYRKVASNDSNNANKAVEIPSNLLEHTEKSEKMDDEEGIKEEKTNESLKRVTWKNENVHRSPKSDIIKELNLILRSLDSLVDDNGAILNARAEPIKKSNINKVVDFFSQKLARKKPIGTKRVLEVIRENELPISDLIINKEVKSFLVKHDKKAKQGQKDLTWMTLSKSF